MFDMGSKRLDTSLASFVVRTIWDSEVIRNSVVLLHGGVSLDNDEAMYTTYLSCDVMDVLSTVVHIPMVPSRRLTVFQSFSHSSDSRHNAAISYEIFLANGHPISHSFLDCRRPGVYALASLNIS